MADLVGGLAPARLARVLLPKSSACPGGCFPAAWQTKKKFVLAKPANVTRHKLQLYWPFLAYSEGQSCRVAGSNNGKAETAGGQAINQIPPFRDIGTERIGLATLPGRANGPASSGLSGLRPHLIWPSNRRASVAGGPDRLSSRACRRAVLLWADSLR